MHERCLVQRTSSRQTFWWMRQAAACG
jgi:hypothetical protein